MIDDKIQAVIDATEASERSSCRLKLINAIIEEYFKDDCTLPTKLVLNKVLNKFLESTK